MILPAIVTHYNNQIIVILYVSTRVHLQTHLLKYNGCQRFTPVQFSNTIKNNRINKILESFNIFKCFT